MKLNILVLTNEYPNEKYPKPDWTWVVPYFCREWVKQGHNVVVINNASSFPVIYYKLAGLFSKQVANYFDVSEEGLDETKWRTCFKFTDYGVRVFNLPMKKLVPGGEYSHGVILGQVLIIKQILDRNDYIPDVITGHWLNPQLRLITELRKYYNNAKTALVFHGDYSKKNCKKHKAGQMIHNVDFVGCRSKTACDEISQYLAIRKCFICASGVPDEYVKDETREKVFHADELHVFTAGRLVKYKNIDAVINACTNSLSQYHLSIAGDGPLRNELEELSKGKGITEHVRFLGKIERDLVQEQMRDADVFILISDKETFGLVYLEAMLQGCIVVASYDGGVDGIIVDGENGFLCNQGDSRMLGEILRKIEALSRDEKAIISKRAIDTAREYTNSKVAERYLRNIGG